MMSSWTALVLVSLGVAWRWVHAAHDSHLPGGLALAVIAIALLVATRRGHPSKWSYLGLVVAGCVIENALGLLYDVDGGGVAARFDLASNALEQRSRVGLGWPWHWSVRRTIVPGAGEEITVLAPGIEGANLWALVGNLCVGAFAGWCVGRVVQRRGKLVQRATFLGALLLATLAVAATTFVAGDSRVVPT